MRLIRRSIATLLIINTLAVALATPLIYLEFSIRRDYIATVLCVNKSKPITICGGKCYLTSNLKKADSQSKESAKPSHQGADLSIFFAANLIGTPALAATEVSPNPTSYTGSWSQMHLTRHSPPPQVA